MKIKIKMKPKFNTIGKFFVCLLLCFCLLTAEVISVSGQSTNPPPQKPNLSPNAEKMKKKIETIGIGKNLTVVMENRGEYYGHILSIEDDKVLIAELDLHKTVEAKYEEMRNVWKNYGAPPTIFGGKRRRPRNQIIFFVAGSAANFCNSIGGKRDEVML